MLVAASTSTMAATYTFYHESGYDDANMPIYLIRGADPLINRFFGEINDLCDDQDFRSPLFDDFDRFCNKLEFDSYDVNYDHAVCDINFYEDFKKACSDQYFRADDDFQRLRSYCESDIFDELDDLCEGREFELDVDDSLREANKDNNVFDKKGNFIGENVTVLTYNGTKTVFVPSYDYYYKQKLEG